MTTTSEIFLVVGATGQQGGAVVRNLLRQGQTVRALVRNAEEASPKTDYLKKQGVELATGDLSDHASLKKALSGVDGIFAMTTPFEAGEEAEVHQGMTLVESVKAANIPHLVYSSVGSAHRNTGIPHFETKWKVEQYIRQLKLPHTIIRPAWFMDNFGTWFRDGVAKGVLSLPIRPNVKLQMVAVKDIGEFGAAALIRSKEFMGHSIELAGDELTMHDVAQHLSRSTERTITFEQLPDEQSESTFGHDFSVMFRWFNEVGYCADIQQLKQQYGIPLTTFTEFLATAEWAKPQAHAAGSRT